MSAGTGEVLENYEWGRKATDQFPWDIWFDGQTRKLTEGVDFPDVMKCVGAADSAANRRGGHVRKSWNRREGWIILTYYPPGVTPPPRSASVHPTA